MTLPEELPDRLRFAGLPVLESDLTAWDKVAALEVIAALSGSKVAVVGIAVHQSQPWGLVPVGEQWRCACEHGELATDFARRSRGEAVAYLESRDESTGAYYAMEFSRQESAA